MAWVHDHTVAAKLNEPLDIHFIADAQLGHSACEPALLEQRVQEILAKPNTAWGFLGDLTDDDRPTTRIRKRQTFADRGEVLSSSARDHLAWIDKEVLPKLAPLTARPCVGVLAGHHWAQISESYNSVQYICAALTKLKRHPVPYIGQMSAWLRMQFDVEVGKKARKTVQRFIHVQHGVGGSQVAGGALRRLERARAGFHADAYVRAHDCHLESAKVAVLRAKETKDARQLMSRTIPLLNIGAASRSYMETLGDPAYPEMEMMQPSAMGWGILRAIPRKAWSFEDPSQNLIVDFRTEI